MDRWLRGVPYADCLYPENPDNLRDIKINGVGSVGAAVMVADAAVSRMKSTKDAYMNACEATIDRGVDELLNRSLISLFKKNFMTELEMM